MRIAKLIKILLLILFAVFAAVQWNDPDPLFWIVIYGITAALLLAHLLGYKSRLLLGLLIIAGVALSFTYIGGVVDYFAADDLGAITEKMHYDRPYIELTREFFGLWMAIGALIFLFFTPAE